MICGDNYVLAAEKSDDRIKEIARFVDEEMRHTSKMLKSYPNYKCAVLSSLNIAEKLMDGNDLLVQLQTEKLQCENQVDHYISKWEDAKLANIDLKEQLEQESIKQGKTDEVINKYKDKLAEMENAYFDLQMENVNLKNELKNIKKFGTEDEF